MRRFDLHERVAPTPIPARRDHPPKVWGRLEVDGNEVVARLSGWRSVMAVKRSVAVPISTIVTVNHDPQVRHHVRTRLRRKSGRTGVIRVGTYHSMEGWSFWSIGLARNAVVLEASGARYRFLIIEVADPAATVKSIRHAAGLGSGVDNDATHTSRQEHPST